MYVGAAFAQICEASVAMQEHQSPARTGKKPVMAGRTRRFVFLAALCVQVVFLSGVLLGYGLPINAWSWGVIILCASLSLPLLLIRRRRHAIGWVVILITADLSLVMPWESTRIQDVRGGRRGVKILPWRCAFGKPGENTALLQHYVGPLKSEWRHQCIRSMLLGNWRDGNERVQSRNPIRYPWLPDALDMLPDDDARQQVLTCLSDPDNLMRVHQGLLLACLKTKGYPPNYDAESWWAHHAELFRSERDPKRAVQSTYGWIGASARCAPSYIGTRPIQKYWDVHTQRQATAYQENGSWGGDPEFGKEYLARELYQETREAIPSGVGAVVWWPDDPLFIDGTAHTSGSFRRLEESPWHNRAPATVPGDEAVEEEP